MVEQNFIHKGWTSKDFLGFFIFKKISNSIIRDRKNAVIFETHSINLNPNFLTMFTINSFSISKLNNAEITAFFINVQRAMSNPENLGVSDVSTTYDETLQKLIDQVYITAGSEFTAAMQSADFKRDQIYKRIRLRLQLVELADDDAPLSALRDTVKTHLLAKYGSSIPQLAYQEETAIVKGFLYDLGQKLTEDDMDTLGISADYAALEQANNAFITAYNSRSAARAEGDRGVTLKLRGEMIDLYQRICFSTQYLANSTLEENATKAAACQTFVGVVNVLLEDAKRRYNQRIANGADAEEGEGEGHTDSTDSTDSGGSNGGSEGENGGNGGSTNSGDSGSGSSDQGGNSGSNSGGSDNAGSGGDDPNKPNGEGNISDGEITF